MSTIYESLLTAALKPDSDEGLRVHMEAIWATVPVHQTPVLEGQNIAITNQQLACMLAVSGDVRDRLLTPSQLTQWNSMLNEAKVKVQTMFKCDPQVANMRYQCETNAHYVAERITEDVLGNADEVPVTQPVFVEDDPTQDDQDNDEDNDGT